MEGGPREGGRGSMSPEATNKSKEQEFIIYNVFLLDHFFTIYFFTSYSISGCLLAFAHTGISQKKQELISTYVQSKL